MKEKLFTKECPCEERNVFLDLLKAIGYILIILLHSCYYSDNNNVWDVIVLGIRTFTMIGVPIFMGVSGYLLFWRKHKQAFFWIKMLKKYLVIFLLYYLLTVCCYYFYLKVGNEYSVFRFALNNSDGWTLWYILVLIEILAVYPIIKALIETGKECVIKYYIIFWFIFVSARMTIEVLIKDTALLETIQFPFFEWHGYIGGTSYAHYPTYCFGVFLTLGFLIYKLENTEVLHNKVNKIAAVIGGGG